MTSIFEGLKPRKNKAFSKQDKIDKGHLGSG